MPFVRRPGPVRGRSPLPVFVREGSPALGELRRPVSESERDHLDHGSAAGRSGTPGRLSPGAPDARRAEPVRAEAPGEGQRPGDSE